jgi:hypothetical protein
MKSLTFLFSNLKIAELANEFSSIIASFDYRITLVGNGNAVYRYGKASLPLPSSDTEKFIAFEEITEDVMIKFLCQSMGCQLEHIEQEMLDEITGTGLITEECLPWERGGQIDD